MTPPLVIIVGAGPAGLTSALELLRQSDHRVLVFEQDAQVGGISKTVQYRGNRMDLGGHRFFSKSDWVMNWWQQILPIAATSEPHVPLTLSFQQATHRVQPLSAAAVNDDDVLLVRQRLSRIYYRRRFFDYPLKLSATTLRNLGPLEAVAIGASYLATRAFPRSPEVSLEDFFMNRFGRRLYGTFFKDYTEKVWGVPCQEISAEWGAQRVKGLSIRKAIGHAIVNAFRSTTDFRQRGVETSLIERFLYPKFGPGQMWERVAEQVTHAGGEIHLQHRVTGIERIGERIVAAHVLDLRINQPRKIACDALISTMPVSHLVSYLHPEDRELLRIARALPYRDYMTAGLLVTRMKRTTGTGASAANGMPPDNWIYIQEPDVRLGRLQIFNNWSPHLVADPATISLGLEYFCKEGDELWSMNDSDFSAFAAAELEKIGLIDRRDVLDSTVVRVPKAYPAYFGEYRHFGALRVFLDRFQNLYAVGRNGMHRYNNQDHSMLAAKAAVDCMISQRSDKSDIWSVNTEDDYHEEARSPKGAPAHNQRSDLDDLASESS